MTPLLKLELRRQRGMVLKMTMFSAIICGLFYIAGKRTPAELLGSVTGAALGATLIVPMGISRDKMEGTLDFLCGLPVDAREIAASRFAAMSVISLPWAVAIAGVSLAVPMPGALNPVAVGVLSWLAMLLLGSCGVAMMACFELETILGVPTVIMVIVVVAVPRAVRAFLPGVTEDAVVALIRQPSAPLVIALALVAAVGIVGAATFGAATRGFGRYGADAGRQ